MSLRRVLPRLCAVLLSSVGVLVAAGALSPARADVPVGWSDPPSVNLVHALLILVAIPLVLALAIIAAVYAPSLARGERVLPAPRRSPTSGWVARAAAPPRSRHPTATTPRPAVPVAAGEPLTPSERAGLEQTIRQAEQSSRVEFSVFVGSSEGEPHAFATQLHNSLVAPARSILIMVDPTRRVVEVVTGGWVRRTLRDQQAELAVAAMQGDFAAGDLAAGLRRGISMLAENARAPQSLHTSEDQP